MKDVTHLVSSKFLQTHYNKWYKWREDYHDFIRMSLTQVFRCVDYKYDIAEQIEEDVK